MSSTERCCFFYAFMPETHHIMPIMWFSLCLGHQTQAFNLAAVLDACGHDIDASGVDAAVAENIRQLGNILLDTVKGPGKELPQIVGKYLTFLDTGGLA